MKILLCNSPWYKPGYYGVRAGSRWPHFEKSVSNYMPFPFFLAYAAASLEKAGFDVSVIDGIAERLSMDEFYARLLNYKPQLVVYEVSTPSIEHDLAVAKETKEKCGQDVLIVLCGAHSSMYNTEFIKNHPFVDIVIQGEYELALVEIVEKLSKQESFNDVAGTIVRIHKTDDIKMNEGRPLCKDLNAFPWPARHLFPMDKYCDLPGGIPAPSLQVWASRGCPYHCIFCSWPQIMYGSSQYRTRDVDDTVNEIAWCVEKYGFKSYYFDDDTFNIGKERMLKLCQKIKEKNLNLPWAIMARADNMDEEILSAMADAGLYSLKYGVESGVQDIVNSSGKSLNLDKVKSVVKYTKGLGIKVHLTFTFGLPGETWDSVKKTIDFATKADPDTLQFSIVTPFPGSKYYNALEEKGYILSKNWQEYDGYKTAVIRTDTLSNKDLEAALKLANRRWLIHVFFKNIKAKPLETIKYVVLNPVRIYRNFFNK
ncbi:MAG: radical SAM protein [Candidatus Magnetoovum sp. WYHC-5]|nr:radical SAM protein [Candidatus Magnetoovum sp. WYHC-5]